ncbi:MAG: hypothetical protein ABIN55_12835 [Aeromicrobium sp.]
MTENPTEPDVQDPDEGPSRPKAPDLPDPAFPEVLPGGDDAPDTAPDTAPDEGGDAQD